MKNLFTLVLVFLFVLPAFSQKEDSACPLNPDFVQWQKNLKNGQQKITSEGFCLNEIPLPVLDDFSRYLENRSSKQVKYDDVYDLRTLNWVSPVKNQGSCGVCWTFATIASLESRCIKNGEGLFDFSEQNIRSCHGFVLTDGTCTGGNPKKSTAYMTRFNGPVLESESPYDTDPASLCDIFTPQYKISGYRALPKDINTLKEAVLNHGAIYTNMYYDSQYYNSGDYTYYYSGTSSTDHAVTLVGWNDNKLTAGGTGAWIVKNSWGSSWGENGYFYVSYNDTKFNSTNAYWTDPEPFDTTETLYMYDELGQISNRGYSDSLGYALVKFVVGSHAQNIEKVACWVNTAGATVDFEVYNTKSGNTLTDLLSSLTNMQCEFPGYYTFNLPAPIPLAAGEDFYIKVKYITPGYGYPIPYEAISTDYADPVIENGVCWLSHYGTTWTETGSLITGKEFDMCVRAYGHNQTVGTENISADNAPVIYPNPCNGILNIDNSKNEYSIVKIISVTGQIVFQSDNHDSSGITIIDCTSIAKGVYTVITESKNGNVYQKLVID